MVPPWAITNVNKQAFIHISGHQLCCFSNSFYSLHEREHQDTNQKRFNVTAGRRSKMSGPSLIL